MDNSANSIDVFLIMVYYNIIKQRAKYFNLLLFIDTNCDIARF